MKSDPTSPHRRIFRQCKRVIRRVSRMFREDPDRFLHSCHGVIHVGANIGQEAHTYHKLNLPVNWIEPIPEVFDQLLVNIDDYPNQIALNELITDADNEEVTLHVANNRGASSSILELNEHKDIWPSVEFVKDISCLSKTLPTALRAANVNVGTYDALVMDTQGSELLVLQGALELLPQFRYIRTEAADFESYKNCATVSSIDAFLAGLGFRLVRKNAFARRKAGGSYFDVLFERE